MTAVRLPPPHSLTHQHLMAIVHTLAVEGRSEVRILDAGCGDGRFMVFLLQCLRVLAPQLQVHLHGFDVGDHGVQAAGFLENTLERLRAAAPDVPWEDRVRMQTIGQAWRFPDESFDLVLSNQVLEHVHDKAFFFAECHRVLRTGGRAVHLAPLKHCVLEGHVLLPWAHRLRDHGTLVRYIAAWSLLGAGKFRAHHAQTGVSREEFSWRHADYLHFWTAYATESETLDLARAAGLRSGFAFSWEFYLLKLRQVLHLPLPVRYRSRRPAVMEAWAVKLLRYLSSCTLVLEKRNTYR